MSTMSARAVAAVRRHDADVAQEHGDHAVWAAVSHGDVIKAIVADALGMHLDLFQRINIDPASITIVTYTSTRPYVLAVNTHAGDLSWLRPPARRRTRKAPAEAVGRWRRWAGSTVGIGWHAWVPSFMDSIRRSASLPARSALPDSAPSSSRHAPEHASRASGSRSNRSPCWPNASTSSSTR